MGINHFLTIKNQNIRHYSVTQTIKVLLIKNKCGELTNKVFKNDSSFYNSMSNTIIF